MKIEIETNGFANGTEIKINGRVVQVKEFKFSVAVMHKRRGKPKGGACKLQMQRPHPTTGKVEPTSYYGADFSKFDEAQEWEENSMEDHKEEKSHE